MRGCERAARASAFLRILSGTVRKQTSMARGTRLHNTKCAMQQQDMAMEHAPARKKCLHERGASSASGTDRVTPRVPSIWGELGGTWNRIPMYSTYMGWGAAVPGQAGGCEQGTQSIVNHLTRPKSNTFPESKQSTFDLELHNAPTDQQSVPSDHPATHCVHSSLQSSAHHEGYEPFDTGSVWMQAAQSQSWGCERTSHLRRVHCRLPTAI